MLTILFPGRRARGGGLGHEVRQVHAQLQANPYRSSWMQEATAYVIEGDEKGNRVGRKKEQRCQQRISEHAIGSQFGEFVTESIIQKITSVCNIVQTISTSLFQAHLRVVL